MGRPCPHAPGECNNPECTPQCSNPGCTPGCNNPRRETPHVTSPSLSARAGALEQWWLAMANEEIERTVPKAIEYGSTDLAEIGRQMASVSGLATPEGLTDEAYWSELGITFYACGKMARVMEAVREGRVASDDSWFDLGVYVRMVQRVRHSGAWPGVSNMRTG